MPKTKFQNVIFTVIMVFVMVYAMICYNISLSIGGMKNEVFLLAFHELIIMLPLAFVLEMFIVAKLAQKLAFRIITPSQGSLQVELPRSVDTYIIYQITRYVKLF